MIPGLVHKCYLAKKNSEKLTIWGTGKPLRQFIYNVDLGKLLIWVVKHYDEVSPLILSVDEAAEVSIRDLAFMVKEAFNFEGDIVFDTTKSDGQFKKTADNSKLRELLPDFQFTELGDGLRDTCNWFAENYDSARK